MKYLASIAALCASLSASAQTPQFETQKQIGTDFKVLLLKAMRSPNGSASEPINGPVADMIRGQIQKPDARVVATVTTVRPLPVEGCKRMKVELSTPGTKINSLDGTKRPLELAFQMNMCENGTPISDQEIAAVGMPATPASK